MMKLQIVHEDQDILIVDKRPGLVVNRAATIKAETLQDQLADYFHLGKDLGPPATPEQAQSCDGGRGIGGRAGIVHRLDRETSGLLVVAKTQKAFDNLQAQFAQRKVKKEYVALVHGFVSKEEGEISSAIGRIGKFGKFGVSKNLADGRQAKTEYEVKAYFQHKLFRGSTPKGVGPLLGLTKSRARYLQNHARDYTLLAVFPKTGRTHQVRVHLKSIGHPPVSDKIYAPAKLLKFDLGWCPRLFLHAASLEFRHPTTKKIVKFRCPLPKDLKLALASLTFDI